MLLDVLADVEGGSHSLPEVEMAQLCRKAGLPPPQRQAERYDDHGRRRYLDLLWPEHRLAVEVDGAFHRDAKTWNDDLDRQNDVATTGVTVLRFSSVTVRTNPERVVAQLRNAIATNDLRELSRNPPVPRPIPHLETACRRPAHDAGLSRGRLVTGLAG
nr:DUF559 domain-containing protein [Micromonospora sp. DSM 115978]